MFYDKTRGARRETLLTSTRVECTVFFFAALSSRFASADCRGPSDPYRFMPPGGFSCHRAGSSGSGSGGSHKWHIWHIPACWFQQQPGPTLFPQPPRQCILRPGRLPQPPGLHVHSHLGRDGHSVVESLSSQKASHSVSIVHEWSSAAADSAAYAALCASSVSSISLCRISSRISSVLLLFLLSRNLSFSYAFIAAFECSHSWSGGSASESSMPLISP